jgi:hypothetical protein
MASSRVANLNAQDSGVMVVSAVNVGIRESSIASRDDVFSFIVWMSELGTGGRGPKWGNVESRDGEIKR